MVLLSCVNARVSKTERGDRNPETHGIREEHILRDGSNELMYQVRLKKVIWDWLSRS